MTLPSPIAVVLAFEDDRKDHRQAVIANAIRQNWSALIKLAPEQRRQRIDEILQGGSNVRADTRGGSF